MSLQESDYVCYLHYCLSVLKVLKFIFVLKISLQFQILIYCTHFCFHVRREVVLMLSYTSDVHLFLLLTASISHISTYHNNAIPTCSFTVCTYQILTSHTMRSWVGHTSGLYAIYVCVYIPYRCAKVNPYHIVDTEWDINKRVYVHK